MKTLLFAHTTVGYKCVKHLIDINDPPCGVVIPESDTGNDTHWKSVKRLVLKHNIPYFQPKLAKNNISFYNDIKRLQPEIGFSCYYPSIIGGEILKLLPKGGINLHGGILPDYSGCFSGVWAIINDSKESGVTLHYMTEGVDKGNIIEIERVIIENEDSAYSLYQKTSDVAVNLFKKAYQYFYDSKHIHSVPQNINARCYYSRKVPFNGVIVWKNSCRFLYNFIRALYFPPYKPAVTYLEDNEIGAAWAEETQVKSTKPCGTIIHIDKKGIIVATKTTDIVLNQLYVNNKPIQINQLSNLGVMLGKQFRG